MFIPPLIHPFSSSYSSRHNDILPFLIPSRHHSSLRQPQLSWRLRLVKRQALPFASTVCVSISHFIISPLMPYFRFHYFYFRFYHNECQPVISSHPPCPPACLHPIKIDSRHTYNCLLWFHLQLRFQLFDDILKIVEDFRLYHLVPSILNQRETKLKPDLCFNIFPAW